MAVEEGGSWIPNRLNEDSERDFVFRVENVAWADGSGDPHPAFVTREERVRTLEIDKAFGITKIVRLR